MVPDDEKWLTCGIGQKKTAVWGKVKRERYPIPVYQSKINVLVGRTLYSLIPGNTLKKNQVRNKFTAIIWQLYGQPPISYDSADAHKIYHGYMK